MSSKSGNKKKDEKKIEGKKISNNEKFTQGEEAQKIEFVSYKKVLILGDVDSGKTSLVSRFENEYFIESTSSKECN